MKIIDLRSDTVTRPTAAMRQVMATAEVGDDVYGEDPTVNRLQELGAELTGQQAALFVPSGTQSNLLALLSHCQRGDEYIVGQQAHCYRYEGGGAAIFGGIQPQPLEFEDDGSLDLPRVADFIKPDDDHFTRTRLLCLENTHHGQVLPLEYQRQAADFCRQHGLSLHLDGARLANAAVAGGVSLKAIAGCYDSASICLSKGLGAPVGSLLCGGHDLIERAHRWRKVAGGGMRQAGILAAAGIYALENNLSRLALDHANARALGESLARIAGLKVDLSKLQTNMVFASCDPARKEALIDALRRQNIFVGGYGQLRFVTHLDVTADDIEQVVDACRAFFAGDSR
jgi:threonine aldolase